MMSQFQAFLLSAAFGILGGALYEPFYFLGKLFSRRAVKIAADLIFCLLFAFLFVIFSVGVSLPPFRFYLFLGLCAGFFLYLKSFHKTVAFFAKKIYNRYKDFKLHKRESKCRTKGRGSRKKKQGASP